MDVSLLFFLFCCIVYKTCILIFAQSHHAFKNRRSWSDEYFTVLQWSPESYLYYDFSTMKLIRSLFSFNERDIPLPCMRSVWKKNGITLVKYINLNKENSYTMQMNVSTLLFFAQLIIPLILMSLIIHSHGEQGM